LSQITADTGLLWWTLVSGVDGRVLSERPSIEVLLDDVVPVRGGDVNGDGVVDEADLAIVLERLGSSGIKARLADITGDGVVDSSDLSDVVRRFGDVGEADHPAFGSLRGDLLECDEVLSCGVDCDLCDGSDWQDFAIRLPGPMPPMPPPPAPWCGASLRHPAYMLWESQDAASFYQLHADATVEWEITEGHELLQYAIVQDNGQRLAIGTATGSGIVEGRALYSRQNPYGSCGWWYPWSIQVDECHAFLEMQPAALAIPLGTEASFFASGLPGGGTFEWWVESAGTTPGPVGIPIVEFVDPGDSPEFVFTAGRYPGSISVYVRYTSDSCQRVRVIDVYAVALEGYDFDNDGLSDFHELMFGTNALDRDTDDDGLGDAGEVACGFDPLDSLSPPSDHPGLLTDTDNDGLSDLEESCGTLTDPEYFDSDGDGLGDGWEVDSGLDPDDPDSDGDGILDGEEDLDGDGLANSEESQHGSNPNDSDTDGDGTSDGDEVDQGGFPNDPRDGGAPPAEDDIVRLRLVVGDHSGSASERWRLVLGNVGLTSPTGEVVDQEFPFWRGQAAAITLDHLGSTISPPDYDYTAYVAAADPESGSIYIRDPDGLLGVDDNGLENTAAGKTAWLYAPIIDLDIDNDNTNGFELPDRSEAEEDLEEEPEGMKVVVVNRGDRDGDAIPDYADGFGGFGAASEGGVDGVRFAPLVVDLRGLPQDSIVRFEYPVAPPQDVMREVVPIPEIQDEYFRYHSGAGILRLWKRDGNEARTADDFVEAGVDYALGDLEPTQTLYVEAVNGSHAPVAITVLVSSDIVPVLSDTVQVLAFDSLTKLSVNEIAGFDIHYGSAVGGPGNDIIIGTDGDDVIEGGGGDDIIVAGRGDDLIDPGDGANVIFASFGQNLIGPEEPPVADGSGPRPPPTELRGPENQDVYLPENGGPITTEAVIRVYKAIYGENDPYLRAFLDPEWGFGRIECVADIGGIQGFFRNHEWDRRYVGSGDYEFVLQLDFEIEVPMVAAFRVREMLMDLAITGNGAGRQIREFIFTNGLYPIADVQDDSDGNIELYQDLVRRATLNAAEGAAQFANLYVAGIGIVSEPVDLVLTVNDIVEGRPEAAIAALPLVPRILTDSGHKGIIRVLRAAGDDVGRFVKIGRVIRPGDCPLGFIPQRDIPVTGRLINDRLTLLLGRGQETAAEHGQQHADAMEYFARVWMDQGDSAYATLNRAMVTATGLENLGSIALRRPDIVSVRPNGKIDVIEIRSPSQSYSQIQAMLDEVWNGLPLNYRGSRIGMDMNGAIFYEVLEP
jgi:hypothetical protein